MRRGSTSQEKIDHYAMADGVSGCLHWSGALRNGYGRVMADGRMENAHRVSYALACGPIPAGLHLHHLCFNRACVNPNHLQPVTLAENNRLSAHLLKGRTVPRGLRGPRRRKTHCKRGHARMPENLTNGGACKLCAKSYKRGS